MPKSSAVARTLPPAASAALRQLGEHLAIARARRRESQRLWAERIGISTPTLIRLERGDPSVGMGAYATALWLIGRVQALGEVATPVADLGALERELREVGRRRPVRSSTSVAARLAGKPAVGSGLPESVAPSGLADPAGVEPGKRARPARAPGPTRGSRTTR